MPYSGANKPFPQKLYQLLEDEKEVLCWLEHGKAFQILDTGKLESEVRALSQIQHGEGSIKCPFDGFQLKTV
jgi:hypothetical protein